MLLYLFQTFPPHQVLRCEHSSWKAKGRSQIPGVSTSCVSTFLPWRLPVGQGRKTPHSDFMCVTALRLGKDPHPQPRQSEGLGRICALLLLGSQSADRETGCKACFQENSCSGDLEVQNPNPQTKVSHLYRPFTGTILFGHHV